MIFYLANAISLVDGNKNCSFQIGSMSVILEPVCINTQKSYWSISKTQDKCSFMDFAWTEQVFKQKWHIKVLNK